VSRELPFTPADAVSRELPVAPAGEVSRELPFTPAYEGPRELPAAPADAVSRELPVTPADAVPHELPAASADEVSREQPLEFKVHSVCTFCHSELVPDATFCPRCGTKRAAADQEVATHVHFKFENLDYDKVVSSDRLADDLKRKTAEAIAYTAQVSPASVDVQLSPGSVVVNAQIYCMSADAADLIAKQMVANHDSLVQSVDKSVSQIPDINSALAPGCGGLGIGGLKINEKSFVEEAPAREADSSAGRSMGTAVADPISASTSRELAISAPTSRELAAEEGSSKKSEDTSKDTSKELVPMRPMTTPSTSRRNSGRRHSGVTAATAQDSIAHDSLAQDSLGLMIQPSSSAASQFSFNDLDAPSEAVQKTAPLRKSSKGRGSASMVQSSTAVTPDSVPKKAPEHTPPPSPAPKPRLQYPPSGSLSTSVGAQVYLEPHIENLPRSFSALRFTALPALPAGLSLDPSTGVISGTPEVPIPTVPYEVILRFDSDITEVRGLEARTNLLLKVAKASRKDLEAKRPPELEVENSALTRDVDASKDSMQSVIKPAEEEHPAFQALKKDPVNLRDLRALVREGKLQEQNLQQDFVDSDGQTLYEIAVANGNLDAVKFFRSGLVIGPTISAASSGSACSLKYPTLPDIILCHSWCQFQAHLAVEESSGISADCQEGMLHFSINPSLPSGLELDVNTGLLMGVPTAECKETLYEVIVSMSEQADKAVQAVCHLRIETMAAPSGLAYPSITRVFDISERHDELPPLDIKRPKTKSEKHRPSMSGKVKTPVATSVLKAPIKKPKFSASPSLTVGWCDNYEIVPALPRGMYLDSSNGKISGLPDHKHHRVFCQCYEVFGYNPVGMSSAKVWLECISGSWELMNVKFLQVNEAGEPVQPLNAPLTPSSMMQSEMEDSERSFEVDVDLGAMATSDSKYARRYSSDKTSSAPPGEQPSPTAESALLPQPCSEEPDWTTIIEKCADCLQSSGKPIRIKEPGGVAGQQTVRGLSAGALIPLLGFQEHQQHHVRRLVRLLERRGHQNPQLQARGLKVCVYSEEALTIGASVVYLASASERGTVQAAGAERLNAEERAISTLPAAVLKSSPASGEATTAPLAGSGQQMTPRLPPAAPPSPRSSELLQGMSLSREKYDKDWIAGVSTISKARSEWKVKGPLTGPSSFSDQAVSFQITDINKEFAALMPSWREKQGSKSVDRSQVLKRWRGENRFP